MSRPDPETAPHASAGRASAIESDAGTPPRTVADRSGLHWWKELLVIGAFYGVYTITRDEFGSASVGFELRP